MLNTWAVGLVGLLTGNLAWALGLGLVVEDERKRVSRFFPHRLEMM